MRGETKRPGLLKRWAGDRRANTAIIFAFALLPIALAAGAAVDLRRQATSKSHLQDAVDSAVLAGIKIYFANTRLDEARRVALATAAADASIAVHVRQYSAAVLNVSSSFTIDAETGEADLAARAESPAAFGAFFGVETLPFNVNSEGVAGGRPVEIALILDNTTSMFDAGGSGTQRFTLMRRAAKTYVDDVFDLAGETAKVSVVPWTTLVNIRSEGVMNPDDGAVTVADVAAAGSRRTPPAAFSDRLGVVAEPRNGNSALSAATLAALSRPTSWRGCVRSSDGEVSVGAGGAVTKAISDAAPTKRWPAALLEPALVAGVKDQKYCRTKREESYTCSSGGGGGGGGGGTTPPAPPVQGSLERDLEGRIELADFVRPAPTVFDDPHPWFQRVATCKRWVCGDQRTGTIAGLRNCVTSFNHQSGTLNGYLHEETICSNNGDYWAGTPPTATGVNRPCVSDPNEFAYLNGGGRTCTWVKDTVPSAPASNPTVWTSAKPIAGPNANCPTAILPLSSNRGQVLNKLNDMYPVPGGTMADVGLLWGLRTLSPRSYWTNFWGITGADARPAPWNSRQADKIAILLTDGVNVAPYNFEGYYGCTRRSRGGLAGNCWSSGNVKSQTLMTNANFEPAKQAANDATADTMMLSACRVMREDYDIDLYVILVDVPGAAALQAAQQCAPEAGHAMSVSSAELDDVFQGIIARTLRLTK